MKAPPNLPSVGDRCRLRGRPATGTVRTINERNQWTQVDWDEGWRAPIICHLHELEREAGLTRTFTAKCQPHTLADARPIAEQD